MRNSQSIENDRIKESINNEINRLGNSKTFLWKLFFISMTPAILNGMHMYAYVFIGRVPNEVTCVIPSLKLANWSYENIKNISSREVENKCNILNWNYTMLSEKTYSEALDYINTNPLPTQISCKSVDEYYFHYDSKDELDSFVPEWDLICERELLRTMVQGSLAFGKFVGAFIFGIVADKFGRKTSVTIGSIIYIIFGLVSTFSHIYWLFLISRVALGIAGSAVYHSAYTLFTEMLAPTYRSNMSILFSLSYPIGTIILAIAAYLVQPWRYLQLAISLPAFLLIITYFFLDESPMWLVSKGKLLKAHQILFGKESIDTSELNEVCGESSTSSEPAQKSTCGFSMATFLHGIKSIFSELVKLYGKRVSRNRLLICHFAWFSTSLAYYVIALNGDNFLANQYWYVAVTGLTEIPSYFLSIIMFKWMGRKSTSLSLFFGSGILLLLILAIPIPDYNNFAISIAIFSRSCVSAVFAVIILHTAELFPTELRNSAIGLSSTMAHIGTIIAPYIVDFFGTLGWYIPTTICGITLIAAGLLILFLPETKNIELYDIMDEKEDQTHKSS